ncbi:MAG TPA: hypothetical protein VM120_26405, partial [Bryobacteraceae bacterium]|nr:hypothetical protein [Bryobacteraceae bacterium]
MKRRAFLGAALALPCLAKLSRSRLTIIADESGSSIDDWIAFARKYRLEALEMRAIQKDGNGVMLDSMAPEELRPIAKRLATEGLRVSFLNSALLKYTLPGTVPVTKEDWYEKLYARLHLTPETMYASRDERLKRALDSAHILGTDKLRTFAFWRVKDP